MIGGDGINDESKKMSPAPLDYFNLTKHILDVLRRK